MEDRLIRTLLTIFDRVLQAMIDVIMNEQFFGIDDGPFDCLQLLGNVQTGTTAFDHADGAAEMAFGTFEPLDDIYVTAVLRDVGLLVCWYRCGGAGSC